MVKISSVEEYLSDKHPDGVGLFRAFQELVAACGESQVDPHKTVVNWKDQRIFASAFILGKGLEIAIHLRRRVNHPTLRQAWNTTQKVVTHRLTIKKEDELDEDIANWLCEALATVGPGTR